MTAMTFGRKMEDWAKLVMAEDVDVVVDESSFHDADPSYLYDFVQYDDDEQGSLSGLPVASAILLDSAAGPIDDSQGERPRERLSFDAADPTVDVPLSYSRPEFIFASARVSDPHRRLGIFLKNRRKGGATIVGLSNDSPFLNCNIQPGDHVVAVNNVLCSGVKASRVVELINSTCKDGIVSICVHNASGDPLSVSCSVQKSHVTTKVGVALQMKRGAVRISRVDKNGLFGNSLLMPHHRCMMINGISCSHMTSKKAAEFIVSLPDRVTIISRPQESYAMTIALCQKIKWWNRFAPRAGLAVRATQTLKVV